MEKLWKLGLFLSFGFAFSAHALAAVPTLIWCNSCTDVQKKSAAAAYPVGTTVYVGDVNSTAIKAWFIDQGWTETQPAQPFNKPTTITPQTAQVDKINALVEYYHTGTLGWNKAGSFSYPVNSINAYGVVNPGVGQNNLTDWVGNTWGVIPIELIDRIVQLASFLRLGDPNAVPHTTYTIYFTAGSKISVTVDYNSTNAVYKVVPNSGRDSHGNVILSAPTNVPTEFNFNGPGNPNDQALWLVQMHLLGYDVTTGTGSYWACTNSAAGYHCVHPY